MTIFNPETGAEIPENETVKIKRRFHAETGERFSDAEMAEWAAKQPRPVDADTGLPVLSPADQDGDPRLAEVQAPNSKFFLTKTEIDFLRKNVVA